MPHRNKSVSVFIADDSPAINERIALILDTSTITVVGQAKTPQDAIDGILAAYPNVVVLSAELDGGSGLQVLRAVRHVAPSIAFVVFGSNASPDERQSYLGEGAEDFLDKSDEFDQLAHAVVKASQHTAY